MKVRTSAPTRIDLAGGTMDIWPLYLFHPEARTVNIAINQRANVEIETKPGNAIEIYSGDLDTSLRLTSIDYIDEVEQDHSLDYIIRFLDFFRPSGGLSIKTNCSSPAGAGLGGSSSLGIALAGGFNYLTDNFYSREELITIVKNIETQVLKIPAGVQDYYPAMFGGLNSVLLDIEGESLVRHSPLLSSQLESHMVLVYSGESRNSGMNNWQVYKSFFDKEESVQDAFLGIQDAAVDMEYALKSGNIAALPKAVEKDMEFRQKIAPGILTEDTKKIYEFGLEKGAKAAKICGAGGGGCILFWVDRPQKAAFEKALRDENHQVINFRVDAQGLSIECN